MKIDKIKIKDNIATIYTSDEEKETKYKILFDDLLDLNLRENVELSNEKQNQLRHSHLFCFGFNKCMRKLSTSDRTTKEIVNMLESIKELEKIDIDSIVEKLSTLGYLSDAAVCESQIYIDQTKLIGKKKTQQVLNKRGVEKAVSDSYFEKVSIEDEIKRGVKKGKILAKKKTNKSFKDQQYSIRCKLIEDGFENIDEIMKELNLEKNAEKEMRLIETMATKAIGNYRKKVSNSELYQKTFRYLLSKGFQSDDIKFVLNNMEVNDED